MRPISGKEVNTSPKGTILCQIPTPRGTKFPERPLYFNSQRVERFLKKPKNLGALERPVSKNI